MLVSGLAAAAALSSLLGASVTPVDRRQASSSSSSSTGSSSSSTSTQGLAMSTLADGSTTTFSATNALPTTMTTAAATSSGSASATTPPSSSATPAADFPVCHDTDTRPFCLPSNRSTLHVGSTYYVTWDPDFFPINSTVTVKLQYANDSQQEAWSSSALDVSWGVATVTMDAAWLQGYSQYNLTFVALDFEPGMPNKVATPYAGPLITLTRAPPNHYKPPSHTKVNKDGLVIGLPVGLGMCTLVVVGLFFGMRKHRTIGLGNIMGRRGDAGYGVAKSRRQRLGLSKKGAIRLQDRDERAPTMPPPVPGAHARGDSLGSLVSDGEPPRENQFRDEIARQQGGR